MTRNWCIDIFHYYLRRYHNLLITIFNLNQDEFMKNCEHSKLWNEIAKFIKFDFKKKSNKQCIRISKFKNQFYQYLIVFIMLKFALNEIKNDVINAKKFDLNKIRFYFFQFSQFRWLIIIWFQIVKTITMILTYKTLMKNYQNVHEKWNESSTTSRHKNSNENEICSIKKKLWHICLCDCNNTFYKHFSIDEHIFIIIFSIMIFDWKKNFEKFIFYDEKNANDVIYMIVHENYDKSVKKVFDYKTNFINQSMSISTKLNSNENANSNVSFVWNEKTNKFFLTSSLRNKYVQKQFQKKSCKYVIITITFLYFDQCEIHFKFNQYFYYIESKQKNSTIFWNFFSYVQH